VDYRLRVPGADIEEEPTGKLLHDLFDEAKHVLSEGTRLLRAEIETAKFEIRREAKKAGPAAALTGVGSVLLHAAVLMFAVAIAAALSLALPAWAAFGIVGVLLAIAGAVFLSRGRNKLRTIELKPTTTIHNLEEDQRWAKGLTQNVRSNLQRDT
jgi:Putative Actinobacterial Holin-X, holin superfamily III